MATQYQNVERLREVDPDKAAQLVLAIMEENDNISQLSDLLFLASDESCSSDMLAAFPYANSLTHVALDLVSRTLSEHASLLEELSVSNKLDCDDIDDKRMAIGVKTDLTLAVIDVSLERLQANDERCKRLISIIKSCLVLIQTIVS